MYQMATIVHHVIYGTTNLTLTEDQLVDQEGNALTELQVATRAAGSARRAETVRDDDVAARRVEADRNV